MNQEIHIKRNGVDLVTISIWTPHLGRPATRSIWAMSEDTLLILKAAIDKFLEKL